ncbi:hypothetical protein NQ318_003007 [Aromia moschata]|uniref:Dynein regulatory complex protein 1 C-terminal domain-containing protein n=1 Tax=Aromia moschata TaxID=1265417 RepID=A0AAV8YQ59_9CUCU|nr:hypothetical protein NQ318_003007 [Aromia moschata]
MLLKDSARFQSLKINRKEDIDLMVNYFVPYTYCARCSAIAEVAPQMSVVMSRYTPSQLSTISTVFSRTEVDNVEFMDLEDACNAIQQPIALIQDIVSDLVSSEESSEDKSNTEENSLVCGEAASENDYTTFKEKKITGKKTFIAEEKMLCQYNHPVVISSVYVLRALREFVTSYYAEREGLLTTRERLEKRRLTFSRTLTEEDISNYWEKFRSIYNEDRVRVWDGLLEGLKRYHEILKVQKSTVTYFGLWREVEAIVGVDDRIFLPTSTDSNLFKMADIA